MSKHVIIRFVGTDPTFTTPKLFVNGREHDCLYCDVDYTLKLTEPETSIFVSVYGYQSNTIKLKLEDEIDLLKVTYFAYENDADEYLSDYSHNIVFALAGMLVQLLNSIPSFSKSSREDMVRIECYKRKQYTFKQ